MFLLFFFPSLFKSVLFGFIGISPFVVPTRVVLSPGVLDVKDLAISTRLYG